MRRSAPLFESIRIGIFSKATIQITPFKRPLAQVLSLPPRCIGQEDVKPYSANDLSFMSMRDSNGKVFLVGAGPGDPGLLTLRGRDLLESADVVVYDALANPKLLDYCPPNCQRIYVGKKAAAHWVPQERINAMLIEQAQLNKRVVRLKGGDPFVFGRGGEEA